MRALSGSIADLGPAVAPSPTTFIVPPICFPASATSSTAHFRPRLRPSGTGCNMPMAVSTNGTRVNADLRPPLLPSLRSAWPCIFWRSACCQMIGEWRSNALPLLRQWLMRREDIVKTNHDAAGAAALAIGAQSHGSHRFLAGGAGQGSDRPCGNRRQRAGFRKSGPWIWATARSLMDYVMLYVHFPAGTGSPCRPCQNLMARLWRLIFIRMDPLPRKAARARRWLCQPRRHRASVSSR